MRETISAVEAAQTMTLAEYRLWWYEQVGVMPPGDSERLTVRQVSDERIIQQGYEYRRQMKQSDHREEMRRQ